MNSAQILNDTINTKNVKVHQSHTYSQTKLCLVWDMAQGTANYLTHNVSQKGDQEALVIRSKHG